ncbi:MAG: DNA polymerase III subunit alpha, partial [Ruminococcus sp.]|nr:DNA polymerase III subunit alpha [Ruminococcus sp.]
LLIKLSRDTGIPLCATNDVHYIDREDSYSQQILMCINTGTTLQDDKKLELPTNDYHLRSYEEMRSLFSGCPEALSNSVRIADKCNLDFEFGVTKLPYFKLDHEEDHFTFLKRLSYEGLDKRYNVPSDNAKKRLEYELSVISQMGYTDYFLIVWDFVHYAKMHDIPVGCGRGSGAGSLTAYCIGITDIDPLKYNLIFERFLNPERVSMPDFDIDFCTEKRQRVIDYVISRYGSDHVSQIVTFGTMGAKQAVRDCARVMGLPYRIGDTVSKLIPFKMTLAESVEHSPDLRKLYNADSDVRELVDTARRIENMPRNISTHAAGVVITKDPVCDYVPLYARDGQISTQFTMTVLERLGLLKMDFLGVSNLTIIDKCVKAIQQFEPDFDIDSIPLDDRAVYELFTKGHTQGIFQFESDGMTATVMQLRPETIEDLIAVLSLYRPGPMDSIPTYIRNRHDPSLVTYKHPMLRSILDVTYGCIVYQEQVMQIFRELAGYSYGRADIVRRAMSKKKHSVLENERKAFIWGDDEVCGAVANGVPEKVADDIFNEMSSFASYAFNKSHAAAYATIAYRNAYLKTHYYKHYMAALLTVTQYDKPHKLFDYINDVKRNGLKILPLDINKSNAGFTACAEGIRFALLSVKGLGEGVISSLVNERELNGDYRSFPDLCIRTSDQGVNLKAIEALIKCGSLDCFGLHRSEMLASAEKILKQANYSRKNTLEGQLDFFGSEVDNTNESFDIPKVPELPLKQLLDYEYDVTGLYLSGHPLDEYLPYANACGALNASSLTSSDNRIKNDSRAEILLRVISEKPYRTKTGQMMSFVQGEDKTGECEVVVFASLYEVARAFLKTGSAVYITGKVSYKDDEPCKIIADMIQTADRFVSDCRNRSICVRVDSDNKKLIGNITEIALKYRADKGSRFALFLSDKKTALSSKSVPYVNICRELLTELQELAGIDNVLFMKNGGN